MRCKRTLNKIIFSFLLVICLFSCASNNSDKSVETKNIDYELDKKEMLNIINDYINTLEKQDRDMFIDYYFNGVKQKHLAKKYSLSQGQISRNLKNIISCLQELLKDYK